MDGQVEMDGIGWDGMGWICMGTTVETFHEQ